MGIIAAHIIVFTQERNSLHYDVVKIHCIGAFEHALIFGIYLGIHLLPVSARLHCKCLGGEQLLLRLAYHTGNRFERKLLVVHVHVFHCLDDRFFLIVGIVDRHLRCVTYAVGVFSDYPHTNGMKCSRPHVGGDLRIVEHSCKPRFDFVRSLVRECYSKNVPRRRWFRCELVKYRSYILRRQLLGSFKIRNVCLAETVRNTV